MIVGNSSRRDAVFIRKSSAVQDETGQKANVANMLKELQVAVSEQMWFEGTVGRRKVQGNESFNRLMSLVEADLISTVYIESQDRWGTADRVELFALIGKLREHRTRLFDLRSKKDLTEKDFTTELIAVINSFKSEKELKDISYRSLRTRVNNFKETGSWPTGTHPFGYGKACYAADGALVWVWQPISRAKGQLYFPTEDGKLKAVGPPDARIPRKERRCKIVLVPNAANPVFIECVRLIFDLYTRVGLSRRQISAQLNADGRRFYDKPFTHSYVTQILGNPAYAGDIHFGKTQTGELHTFDKDGIVVPLTDAAPVGDRALVNRIIKERTHDPLVDRETWNMAQEKLVAERQRTSYAPRNPAYYLKQIFVCGHCGSGMVGRTEIDSRSGRRTVVYVCGSYVKGRCNGQTVACGYHRITHVEAECLLLDKIKERDLNFDALASIRARDNLDQRLGLLRKADKAAGKHWKELFLEAVSTVSDFFYENYWTSSETWPQYPEHQRLRKLAWEFYSDKDLSDACFKGLPVQFAAFRDTVKAAESAAVEKAEAELRKLRETHKAYTLAKATASEMERQVLQDEIQRLEAQIRIWEPRTVAMSERLNALYAGEAQRRDERRSLKAEWPKMECREKGEALRRLFKKVTLYWDATFHHAPAKPSRPRTTARLGRYSYALQVDRIGWEFAATDLGGCW